TAAVRKPLAVLYHKIDVMLRTWHLWLTRVRVLYFGNPMNFGHSGAVWERLAIGRDALLIGVDHRRVAHYRSKLAAVLADRDHSPVFVSSELREPEPIRHFDGVLVLSRDCDACRENGNRCRNTGVDQRAFSHCRFSSVDVVPLGSVL